MNCFAKRFTGALLVLLLGLSGMAWGQGSEDFSNLPTTSSSSYLERSWTGTDEVTWTAQGARTDQTINGKSICWGNSGTRNVISSSYSGGLGTLTFNYVRAFTGTSARSLEVYVNNIKIGSTITVSPTSDDVVNYSEVVNVAGNVVLEIRSTGSAQVKVDDIAWTGYSASDPLIITSTLSLNGFSYIEGSGPSAEQSFSVSGSNLTGNISITAPTNYEISEGTGASFSANSPITLTQSGGTVSETTIYVRLKAGLDVGDYNNEDVTIASSGATSKTVTCSGSVTPATGIFRKISSLAEMTNGYFVIANSGDAFAMNNTNAGSYFEHTAISPVEGVLEHPVPELIWKIETDGGGHTLYNETSEKYVSYTGPDNKAYAVDAVEGDNQRWSISYTSDVFTFESIGIPGRILQYNASTPRFACYTSAQQKLLLYKLYASEPAVQPSSLEITDVGSDGFTISWVPGSGENSIVLVKEGAEIDSPPLDGVSYTGNAAFGAGSQIGTGNYVVYSGSSTSVTVTGLSGGTTYYIAIADYNGSGGSENYCIDDPLTGSQLTAAGAVPADPTVRNWYPTTTSQYFSWDLNASGDPVLVLFTEADTILAEPVDEESYAVSDSIGNAVVIYAGTDTCLTHSGLTPNTQYYYGLFSYNGTYTYSGGLRGPGMTLKAEPSNHAADFHVSGIGTSHLTFSWEDNDGTYPADRFMVALEVTPSLEPADGNEYHNAHEQWVTYVDHGVGTVSFTGLEESTTYSVSIWPVSNADWQPAYWDYKTDGMVPGFSQATRSIPSLPFAEEFDYPLDAPLTDCGWSAHSGEGSYPVSVVASTIAYPGYLSSGIGNSTALTNSGEDVNLGFAPETEGTIFLSCLVNVSAAPTGGEYFLHLGPSPIATTYRGRVFVKEDGGKLAFGIANSTSTVTYTDAVYDLSTTYLLVLKYEIGTGSSIYINPALNSSLPETGWVVATDAYSATDNIGSVALRQGSNSLQMKIDGIRIANTWEYLVGEPGGATASIPAGTSINQPFGGTGVTLSFGTVSNGANVTANKYESAPANIAFAGTAPLHHSGYRWVINAGGLGFENGTIKIAVEGLPGIGDPDLVDIYKRSTPGSGSFEKLETTYTDGYLSAAITSFSEFILGSDDIDTPLPISLASFTAEAANGKVIVSWVTESETENAAFRIYRDGELQTELEGAGTTAEPQSYSWTDNFVIPGKTYSYVLADVDLQGKETRHNEIKVEVEVEGIAQDYNIGSAYPNPFNPTTVVPVNLAKDAVVKAMLYDITGRPLQELQNGTLSAGSHALTVNGANLSTGIYFVRIGINDQMHVQKIALMK